MLSDEEKKELLEDARSISRRDNFRLAQKKGSDVISFDDYLFFLNSIQKIFSPFKAHSCMTPTKLNRL